ncbi:MAG: hypothetical protein ACTSVB_08080 [Candidatus Heimdallarchaeaceae archaeon]
MKMTINYVYLYFKSRRIIINKLFLTIFLLSIGINLSTNILYLKNPAQMSYYFGEDFESCPYLDEQDIVFSGVNNNNISRILEYEKILNNIEKSVNWQKGTPIFSQSYILSSIEAFNEDSNIGVAFTLISCLNEVLEAINISNLNETQGILIYTQNEPLLNLNLTDHYFIVGKSKQRIQIIHSISLKEFGTEFPQLSYLLSKTFYSHNIILPPSFFKKLSNRENFIFGSSNLIEEYKQKLVWSSDGKKMFDSLTNSFINEFFKYEIQLDFFEGKVVDEREESQLIVELVETVFNYIQILVIAFSMIFLIHVGYNLVNKNKEVEVEFHLISNTKNKYYWILESFLITIVGFISGYFFALLIFRIILSSSSVKELSISIFVKELGMFILANYLIVQLIVFSLYMWNRIQLISKINKQQQVTKKILASVLVLSAFSILLIRNVYTNLAIYVVFALVYFFFISLKFILKYSQKILSSLVEKLNLLTKKPLLLLLTNVYKKSIKRKMFVTILLTVGFFILIVGANRAKNLTLDEQTWGIGGEISGSLINLENQNNTEIFLQSIPEIKKFLPVIEIMDTTLGTENTFISNSLNIFSFDWEKGLDYYGREKVESWLKYENIPDNMNNSVLLSEDFEELGFTRESEFKIYLLNKTSEELLSQDFEIKNHFKFWPGLTSNINDEDSGSSDLWVIMSYNDLFNLLKIAKINYSLTYKIRVEINDIEKVVNKLAAKEIFDELIYVDTNIASMYQHFIYLPVVLSIIALFPILGTQFIVSDKLNLEEKRALAFVSLSQDPKRANLQHRLLETLFLILLSVLLVLLLNIVTSLITSVLFNSIAMEIHYQNFYSSFVCLCLLSGSIVVTNAFDFIRHRNIDPAITLRHLE